MLIIQHVKTALNKFQRRSANVRKVKMVPRRRLELPRLAAQVPETCASTNSATWAGEGGDLRARAFDVNCAADARRGERAGP